MATTKSSNENFNMDDFDELLAALSAEDLDKVNDIIDPEVNDFYFIFLSLNIFILFRIHIYQQVNVVNNKQQKQQLVHMIVLNFLSSLLNKEKMKKIGIIINHMFLVKKKVKFGNQLL
jgi:hypothetical protein